jgi:hypothetical protein
MRAFPMGVPHENVVISPAQNPTEKLSWLSADRHPAKENFLAISVKSMFSHVVKPK